MIEKEMVRNIMQTQNGQNSSDEEEVPRMRTVIFRPNARMSFLFDSEDEDENN